MRWLTLLSLLLLSCAQRPIHAHDKTTHKLLKTSNDTLTADISFERQDGFKLYWTITNRSKGTVLAPDALYLYHDSGLQPLYARTTPLKPGAKRVVTLYLYPHRPATGGTFKRDAFVYVYSTNGDSATKPEKYDLHIRCNVLPAKQTDMPSPTRN